VVRVLEHILVRLCRPDRADHTFADARDDRFLTRAADQPIDVGPHGDASHRDQLNTVLGDGGNPRGFDHLGNHRHLDGFEHVTAGEIDGGRALECHFYIAHR
jgi:hypothetical protein